MDQYYSSSNYPNGYYNDQQAHFYPAEQQQPSPPTPHSPRLVDPYHSQPQRYQGKASVLCSGTLPRDYCLLPATLLPLDPSAARADRFPCHSLQIPHYSSSSLQHGITSNSSHSTTLNLGHQLFPPLPYRPTPTSTAPLRRALQTLLHHLPQELSFLTRAHQHTYRQRLSILLTSTRLLHLPRCSRTSAPRRSLPDGDLPPTPTPRAGHHTTRSG